MSTSVPRWLQDALAANPAPPSPEYRAEQPEDVVQGDIVLVAPTVHAKAEARLALVLKADQDNRVVAVAIANNLIWLATRTDPVLHPELTDLAYPICVLTQFSGHVFRDQIIRLIGGVDDETMEAVFLAQSGEDQGTVEVGLPLLDPALDDRWAELQREADNFRRLTSACEESLIAPEGPALLDPAIFDAQAVTALAATNVTQLRALVEAAQHGELLVPAAGVQALLEEDAIVDDPILVSFLEPLLSAAASAPQSPKTRQRSSINGRACRTPSERALVRAVFDEVDKTGSRRQRVQTAPELRKAVGKQWTIVSDRERVECLLIA